jgi:hypothetical protein
MPPEAFDCGGSHPPPFGFVMEKRRNPVATRRPAKTKPLLKAVNQESQQSRACGILYFVVTFLRTDFWQTV